MLYFSLLLLLTAVDDAVDAAVDVVVPDVTPPPVSDTIVWSADSSEGLSLLLALLFFIFFLCLRSFCFLSPSLLLVFSDDEEVVDDIDAASIGLEFPIRWCILRV